VAAHWLVNVHRVQARRIEAGEPHVAHKHDPEGIGGIAKAVRQHLPPRLVPNVWLPVGRVGCGAGHYDFDVSIVVVIVVPSGAQTQQFAIEIDTDTPAHADDHCLAFEGFEPLLEMVNNVLRYKLQPLVGPTIASSCAHLLLSFSFRSTSSPSVAS
jgi:hypothetical protein